MADLLERRWTVSIIYASHAGAVRFNEFIQTLGTIPPATLAQRLADLEQAGVFERTVIDARVACRPPGGLLDGEVIGELSCGCGNCGRCGGSGAVELRGLADALDHPL